MYKFTNGIVVYDERTRDNLIKAGYKLVKNENKKEQPVEENVEVVDNDTEEPDTSRVVNKEHSGSNSKTSKSRN